MFLLLLNHVDILFTSAPSFLPTNNPNFHSLSLLAAPLRVLLSLVRSIDHLFRQTEGHQRHHFLRPHVSNQPSFGHFRPQRCLQNPLQSLNITLPIDRSHLNRVGNRILGSAEHIAVDQRKRVRKVLLHKSGQKYAKAASKHVAEELCGHRKVHHNLRNGNIFLGDLRDELARVQIERLHVLLQLSVTPQPQSDFIQLQIFVQIFKAERV